MGKKNLADNPAVIARAEAVMKRMDDEELAREATKIVDEGIMTEDDVQRLAEYAAKIDAANIIPNASLGTMPAQVIVPVEATLDHILQELAQLESQCGAASTIEHALHKAAEFVRLAKIDYKYL